MTGRNDPCPCGSNKKYKKCCLLKQDGYSSSSSGLDNVRQIRDWLYDEVLKFSQKIYSQDDFIEAWDEWCMEFEESPDQSLNENILFMSWFLFNWGNPAIEEGEFPVSVIYLSNNENKFDERKVDYFRSINNGAFSFYEIIDTKPWVGIQVKCVFTGSEYFVHERSGSQNVTEGGLLYGRIATVGEISIFDALSDILFPPSWKLQLLDFRKEIKRRKRIKKDNMLTVEHLRYYEDDIRFSYREMRNRAQNPVAPQLTNTDREPLSFHKVIFKVKDIDQAFNQLAFLCINESKEELLNFAERDSSGKLIKIEFPWVKQGNRVHAGMENTVLGHITLEIGQMTVEVNSNNRATVICEIVNKTCPDIVKYKATLMESPEETMKRHTERATDNHQEGSLKNDPDVKAKLQEMYRLHMESWPTQKIPALGNKTPKQAIKNPEGREKVLALLIDFENSAGRAIDREFEREIISKIKRELGL